MANISESSQPVTQTGQNGGPTSRETEAEVDDSKIDYLDIPETSDEDWKDAVRGKFYRPKQQHVVIIED